jgi:hypothetical protein
MATECDAQQRVETDRALPGCAGLSVPFDDVIAKRARAPRRDRQTLNVLARPLREHLVERLQCHRSGSSLAMAEAFRTSKAAWTDIAGRRLGGVDTGVGVPGNRQQHVGSVASRTPFAAEHPRHDDFVDNAAVDDKGRRPVTVARMSISPSSDASRPPEVRDVRSLASRGVIATNASRLEYHLMVPTRSASSSRGRGVRKPLLSAVCESRSARRAAAEGASRAEILPLARACSYKSVHWLLHAPFADVSL